MKRLSIIAIALLFAGCSTTDRPASGETPYLWPNPRTSSTSAEEPNPPVNLWTALKLSSIERIVVVSESRLEEPAEAEVVSTTDPKAISEFRKKIARLGVNGPHITPSVQLAYHRIVLMDSFRGVSELTAWGNYILSPDGTGMVVGGFSEGILGYEYSTKAEREQWLESWIAKCKG